ncbi:hypothetical protein B0H14DRAFT_2573379 [Mycena olivaceomarginata]|nr:hypothetical protein B0H14DRAFT_2573379 [Mycena olivaceomarginata]
MWQRSLGGVYIPILPPLDHNSQTANKRRSSACRLREALGVIAVHSILQTVCSSDVYEDGRVSTPAVTMPSNLALHAADMEALAECLNQVDPTLIPRLLEYIQNSVTNRALSSVPEAVQELNISPGHLASNLLLHTQIRSGTNQTQTRTPLNDGQDVCLFWHDIQELLESRTESDGLNHISGAVNFPCNESSSETTTRSDHRDISQFKSYQILQKSLSVDITAICVSNTGFGLRNRCMNRFDDDFTRLRESAQMGIIRREGLRHVQTSKSTKSESNNS